MITIGWGFFQVPLVSHYRVCFCCRRPLYQCVTGTGWKMFIQCSLRIILLVAWGMQFIDYSLPQSEEKIIGIYFELAILGLQVVDGVVTILSWWFKSLTMLYPVLVVIPSCFVADFVIKATCYGPLFLSPKVTAFGVFSLIEVWFRNITQMYSWVAVLSFVHFSKDKLNPFEKEKIVKKFNPSPFSRTSTISGRGRRSFLLKSKEPKHQSVDSQDTSSNIERSNLLSPSSRVSLPKSHPGMSKYSRSMPEDGNHKRVKRIGGFIPSLLKRERTEIPEDQKTRTVDGFAGFIPQPNISHSAQNQDNSFFV